MEKRTKYLLLITVFSIVILIDIALFINPIQAKVNSSIIADIPIFFWGFLILSSALIFITSYVAKNKGISMFMGVLYYFVFYAVNFAYKVIPEQSDIGSTGVMGKYLSNATYINPDLDVYFEWPVFWNFQAIMQKTLGLNIFETINIGFFLLMLTIPIILPLILHKKYEEGNKHIYLLMPAVYIILTYFFINSQFVPQFLGLIFLIATTGAYIKYRDTFDIKYNILTLLFFALCVFTHPFMFIFFIIGLIYYKLYIYISGPKKILKVFKVAEKEVSLYQIGLDKIKSMIFDWRIVFGKTSEYINLKISRIKGKKNTKDVSLTLMMLIYLMGYINGFYKQGFLRQILDPVAGRGETWFIVARLLGNKRAAGLIDFSISPLFQIIPEPIYLSVRYSSLLILVFLSFVLMSNISKLSLKKIQLMDIFIAIGSFAFVIAGFLNNAFLGQRSFQATFMGISKYSDQKKSMGNIRKALIIGTIIVAPLVFTFNVSINHTVSGNQHIEDDSTLSAGSFIEKYAYDNQTVVIPDRSLKPILNLTENGEEGVNREFPNPYDPEFNIDSIDMIIYTPKIKNRLSYFSFDIDDYVTKNYTVYDQGNSQILLNDY